MQDNDEENNFGRCITQTLDVGSIRSVKVSSKAKRKTAFEIFTHDKKTFVLKAKDGGDAQQWVQCLSVARAHSQVRWQPLMKFLPSFVQNAFWRVCDCENPSNEFSFLPRKFFPIRLKSEKTFGKKWI